MAVVGRASVLVAPTFSGFQRSVTKELSTAGAAGGQAASKGFGSSLARFGKAGAAAAGATIAAGFGVALTKGMGRLVAIENAQAKMRGLGHDTATVDKIMKNALASVKGTAFGLGEAATTAAGAVAAGIKPGTELESVLKSVANSAAAAGVGMDEMGGIYNKVASVGKAQNDVLRQVSERGIPIYEALAKQLGVTTDEVFKLASDGKIGFQQFEDAMTSASGTVASEMGKTFTGSLANTWAAFGRIGANLLSGVFVKLAPALQGATGWLERLEPAAKRVGEAIGSFIDRAVPGLQGLYDLVVRGDFTGKLRDAFGWEEDGKAVAFLMSVREGVEGLVKLFTGQGTGMLAGWLGVEQGHPVIQMLQGLRDLVSEGIPKAFRFLGDVAEGVFKVLTKRGTGQLAKALGVEQGSPIISGLQTLRDVAVTTFTGLWDAFSRLDFSSWEDFRASLAPAGSDIATSFGSIGDSLGKMAPKLGQVVSALPQLAGSVGTILGAGLKVLVSTLGFLADNIDTVVKFLPALLAGYAAWRVASVALTAQSNALQWAQAAMAPVLLANNALRLVNITLENRQTKARLANTGATTANTTATAANTGAQNAGVLTRIRATAASIAHRVATVAATVATTAMTAAQKALNLVLRANPIGIVITAITLLVGALVVLYKRNETVRNVIDAAWATIKLAISGVVTWFRDTAWPWLRDALGNIRDRFVSTKDRVVGAWDAIKSGISTGWDAIKGIFDRFKAGLSSLRDRFRSIRDGISDVWRGLTNVIARPINAVIDKINAFLSNLKSGLNKIPGVNIEGNWSIRKIILDTATATVGGHGARAAQALASGGPVRGWSPHKRADNIMARLTAGEFVQPVDTVRHYGARAMEWVRQRKAMILPAFASGGPVGGEGLGDKARDWLSGLWDNATGWMKSMWNRLMPDFGGSWVGQLAKGVLGKVDLSALGQWIKDKHGATYGGGVNYPGPYGWHPTGMAFPAIVQKILQAVPNAIITSTFRSGATTASGIRSLHSLGRAVDWITPGMRGMTEAFRKVGRIMPWSQHFYTPAGARYQHGFVDDKIRRDHHDHGHTALAYGGLVGKPFVADSGALLAPGINVLDNRTGGPEPLGRLDKPITLSAESIGDLARAQAYALEQANLVAVVDRRDLTRFMSEQSQRNQRGLVRSP